MEENEKKVQERVVLVAVQLPNRPEVEPRWREL